MAGKNGKWEDLFEQCKTCSNLKAFSVFMDGTCTYNCNSYPLFEDVPCPMRIQKTDSEQV